MKIFTHLYSNCTSLENLFQAWEEFKKGKRNKADVACFERRLEDNLFQLHTDLLNKTYNHSPYAGFYIKDPEVRHIHKAVVRDRIVHHALFKTLNPLFEPTFISDSYSCRKGYGSHKGFKKLVNYCRKVSKNYIGNCWALKCDVKKFFDSIDHRVLTAAIEAKIKDPDLAWSVRETIGSYQVTEGKGIPIGNLTSQLFANIYLNRLDQFVKQELKVKYYLRYADDFILLNQNKDVLVQNFTKLERFLTEELRLNLHPNKIFLRKLSWGIDFVGYVALPYHQVLRTKTKQRIYRKVKQKIRDFKQGEIDSNSLNQSIHSYFGILTHANTFKLEKDLKNEIWFSLTNSG